MYHWHSPADFLLLGHQDSTITYKITILQRNSFIFMEIALDKKDSSILLPIPYLHPLFHSHKNNCLQISDFKNRQQESHQRY